MNAIQPIATFRTGCAGARHVVGLSCAMDAFHPDEPYTRAFMYNERAKNIWTFNEQDFVVPAMCVWRDPVPPHTRCFVALGEDGHVAILGDSTDLEEIADSGLRRPASTGFGYVTDVIQIGARLYACGDGGQIYRRLARNQWEHMDGGILQAPGMGKGAYMISAIDGPAEGSIYIAGSERGRGQPGRADHWNGHMWTRLTLPSGTGRLTAIHVESAERVWMVGAKGTLLLGNAFDGFRNFGPLGDTKLILSMTLFQGLGYLGTNVGLYKFDPAIPGRVYAKVRTGLDPELQDANVVQAVDDVLWSIGPKDLARFDGQAWTRIHHPDNPPIAP
jgi:hypothetical protein